MGKETARALATMSATVVMVGRNRERGEAAQREIRESSGNEKVDLIVADLSSQTGVHKAAEEFLAKYDKLHVLVNNAGGVFSKRETTVDGLEMTFALDHLAYFLLTNLLLDTLKRSAPARIVNISSGAEATGKINFDDLQGEKKYSAFAAYSQAKLANVLFTYELARRLAGTGVTVNAVTPGPVLTNFGQNNGGLYKLIVPVFSVFGLSAEQGAQTAIWLASSAKAAGITGKAFYRLKEKHTSVRSHNVATQRRLWDASAELTKMPVHV
jgi:NAD(P)-dependent dehydrogenase (short-subunit alcohol dehydrogenase family)